MKKCWITLIALLLAVILPFSVFAEAAKLNTKPLSFKTTTLYGKSFSSDVFKNYDLVVVNCWAEWCYPCVEELPAFQQIHKKYKNVLVIGAYCSTNNDAAKEKAEECGITYPLISMRSVSVLYDYIYIEGGSFSIPQTVFFNNQGLQIRDSFIGGADYEIWASRVEEALEELVDEPETVSAVIGGLKYDLDPKAGTATLTGAADKSVTKLTIPASVKYQGKKYNVTAIAPNALKKYTALTSLVIGKNIEKIGQSACYGCKNLININIKTKKLTSETVDQNAFKSISKKAVVKCPSGMADTYKTVLVNAGAPKSITCK